MKRRIWKIMKPELLSLGKVENRFMWLRVGHKNLEFSVIVEEGEIEGMLSTLGRKSRTWESEATKHLDKTETEKKSTT